jgi:hypothetical protein
LLASRFLQHYAEKYKKRIREISSLALLCCCATTGRASLDNVEKIQRDLFDGRRLGINGTPTLYINGKRLADNSYESIKSAIEPVLKAEALVR